MRNQFLGLICFLYGVIVFFVFLTDKMDNYLAPNMQLYLKIALPVLFIIGIVLLLSKEKQSFHGKELVLLIPVIFLISSGDGKLTINFAYNRNNSFQASRVSTKNNEPKKEKEMTKDENGLQKEDADCQSIDFTKVDFDVIDESYSGLSEAITYSRNPEKLVGKTIRVRGFSLKKSPFIPNDYFGLGKYEISCCAADAGFVGYMVKADNSSKIQDNTWYEIEGVLELGEDTYGQTISVIRMVHYKKISSKGEKQYVYPCYAYGNGKCEEVTKYNLD